MNDYTKNDKREYIYIGGGRNCGKAFHAARILKQKKAEKNKELFTIMNEPVKIDKMWIDEAAGYFAEPNMWRDFKKHWKVIVPCAFLAVAVMWILYIGLWALIPYVPTGR